MREWTLTWPDYVRSPNVVFTDWAGKGRRPSFFHILAFEWRLWGPFARYTGFHWKHLIPNKNSLKTWGWKEYFRYPWNHLCWKAMCWVRLFKQAYALMSGDAVLTERA